MADLATEMRRAALKDHATSEMETQDHLDIRDSALETPQEMHERMLAEDAGEETLDLLEALREMQGGEMVTWKVWRIAGPNGEPLRSGPEEYCGHLGNTQLTMENMASLWGGGKYRVKGRFASGKIAGGRTITIAADAKRNEEPMATVVGGSGSAFNMAEFMAMQQQQDKARDERFEKRLLTMATICAPIIAAFVGRPPAGSTDLAALITALKKDPTPPVDPITSMKGMVETMTMLKALSGGDGGGGDDTFVEIVKAVAPHAGPALAAYASRQQAAPVRMRVQKPAPGSQPTKPPPVSIQATVVNPSPKAAPVQAAGPAGHTGVNLDAPSQPMTDQDRNMFAQLKPQVDTLVQMFRDGADPVQCAQVFFDTTMMGVDDSTYDKLCGFFENPQAIAQISIFNTGVSELSPKFETFQKKVMELIAGQDQAASGIGGSNPPST